METRHMINLRGPWQYAAAAPDSGGSDFRRFRFPDELGSLAEHAQASPILLARDFGRPSGLTDQHRVELVIDPIRCCSAVVLNDERLEFAVDEGGWGRCEITPLVRWRNRLRITYEVPPADAARAPRLRDVRIEILEPLGTQ